MSEDLTPRQQILLWDLISRGGSALQMDLKPKVEPKDREPLVRAKLISVAKVNRALQLTLEERGWNHLATTAPTLAKSEGSKYDRPILQFVLSQLQKHVSAGKSSYFELFAERPNAQPEVQIGESSADQGKEDQTPAIEAAVRSAFFEIAGRPARNQVRLRQLRDRLSAISRVDLDKALIDMRDARRARFSTLSNPLDIADEGDAALSIRNVAYHTIWIDT